MSKFIERRKKTRSSHRKRVVIYHGNCSDGFGGAWAAWKKFGRSADYLSVMHQTEPPRLTGREIYLIDFCYHGPDLAKLMRENARVTAIDHHISVEKDIKSTEKYLYSQKNSGAVLSWKYFHPGKPVPKMLLYIEDMDLWQFDMAHTKEVFAALDLYDFDFKVWDKLAHALETPAGRAEYIERGRLILAYENKLVERLVGNAELVLFEGHKTYAVNTPNFTSEICHKLYKKLPPIAIAWSERQGQIVVSLRSNGTVDVAKLAGRFGGGGHKASAGFRLDAGEHLPWKRF